MATCLCVGLRLRLGMAGRLSANSFDGKRKRPGSIPSRIFASRNSRMTWRCSSSAYLSKTFSLEFDSRFQSGATAFIFLLLQPEKQISLGRRIRDAVVDDGAEIVAPSRRGEIGVGLQCPAGHGWRPRHDGLIANVGDGEQRGAGGLHGVERPEAAGHGIIPAAHCPAGVRLADGAADGKNAAGAGAAATGDFIPVNRVLLPQYPKAEGRM